MIHPTTYSFTEVAWAIVPINIYPWFYFVPEWLLGPGIYIRQPLIVTFNGLCHVISFFSSENHSAYVRKPFFFWKSPATLIYWWRRPTITYATTLTRKWKDLMFPLLFCAYMWVREKGVVLCVSQYVYRNWGSYDFFWLRANCKGQQKNWSQFHYCRWQDEKNQCSMKKQGWVSFVICFVRNVNSRWKRESILFSSTDDNIEASGICCSGQGVPRLDLHIKEGTKRIKKKLWVYFLRNQDVVKKIGKFIFSRCLQHFGRHLCKPKVDLLWHCFQVLLTRTRD